MSIKNKVEQTDAPMDSDEELHWYNLLWPISPKVVKMIWIFIGIIIIIVIISSIMYLVKINTETAPRFQAVLPSGKSINDLGGWTRVSPPGETPAFAYTDTINDVNLSVTEQQLPATSKKELNSKVADIAKQYNSNNKVEAKDTIVYIGNSSKGPQSVISTKGGLLILIKSQSKISDNSWADYIDSLQ